MFGGSKPTFGASTTNTGFGGFNNTTTTSPFGQSAFGKPATATFGATPTFGQQQTTPSLFGAAGQPQSSGLFGGASTSSGFGSTATAQPAFGGFSQPQQNTSIFGGAQPTASSNSLFGQQSKPAGTLGAFGQPTTQSGSSLFGQQPTATSTSGFATFGQAPATNTSVFGSAPTSAFGQPTTTASAANAGSAIAKYQPTNGTDTLMKGGQPNNVNTKLHCLTAMKEYESKSLEELRMEDYLANRKGPQASTSGTGGFFSTAAQPNATGTGLFGANQQQSTGLFGQQAAGTAENKSIFGTSAFGQPATSAFGAAPQQQNSFLSKSFGAPTPTPFGINPTDASANPFGTKPVFGQAATPSLFGQAATANTAAPAFGQTTTTGFTGFGTTAAPQQPSLFGGSTNDANKPAFGLGVASTANNAFPGFGAPATSTAGGGLFGTKPNTGFGAAPAFGATATTNQGFPNFSMNNPGGGLFNSNMNKAPAPAFTGFSTQAAPLNTFNTGTGTSLFGNTGAPKPGGLFGTNTGTFGTGNTTLGGGFGTGTLGGANTNPLGGLNMATQQQAVPIHQQILSKVTSPYGENSIFKDLKRSAHSNATRATNPVAQKAVLEVSNNDFKISTKESPSVVKFKPVCGALTKKSLFEGLEEYDSSVETFSLKSNLKRLELKPVRNTLLISNGGISANNTIASSPAPQSPANISNGSIGRNDSFSGNIAPEPSTSQTAAATLVKDNETSRRESWLHPKNLEKVRQHNLNLGVENGSTMNNTLSELVPRKPLETFRPPSTARLSVSTIPENPFEDQSSELSRRETVIDTPNESLLSNRSIGTKERSAIEEQEGDEDEPDYEEHPTGITLRRIGYYSIPSLDDLKSYLAEDGTCIVPHFTVGREGYGNVCFGKEMDVAGLNLDEIVHFRNKEVIIYPDDDNKPPVGNGLNRDAQVTLDQVWPHDKTKHEPIKDPTRLAELNWEAKLRRVCDKNDTRFIEYRPETGSWVFRVKHFSKYGLSDSDEEEEVKVPTDPKKAKMTASNSKLVNVEKMSLIALQSGQKSTEEGARALDPRNVDSFYPMDESAEFMLMDKTQFFQNQGTDYSMFSQFRNDGIANDIAKNVGSDVHKLQLMKASFFADEYDYEVYKKSDVHEIYKRRAVPLGRNDDVLYAPAQSQWSQMENGFSVSPVPGSESASIGSSMPASRAESPVADIEPTLPVPAPKIAKLPSHFYTPKVAPVKPLASQVPFGQSFVYSLKNIWPSDLGIYNSRRFKIGFGPQNSLVFPTTLNNQKSYVKNSNLFETAPQLFKLRDNNDFSPDILQHIKIASAGHYEHFERSIIDHLDIQLSNSLQQEVAGSECPHIISNRGTDLIVKHLDEAIKQINLGTLEEYAVSVWSLCLALWGDHEELEGQDSNSHFSVMYRRDLLSEWLENELTEKDLMTKNISQQTYLLHLLDLVMCHKVNEACELAFNYDDGNLALTLSQLSSGPRFRKLVVDQLSAWHTNESDKFIQLERLKLYMFAGGVSLMSSTHGPINNLEGIEWIKALALQVWYFSSPTSSITDALKAYDAAFTSEEFYALPPTPAYDDNSGVRVKRTLFDLRYHLLQLFSKRSHPLEPLLNPATHTIDPLDYRLSWLLLQTLEALGYSHCSELSESQLHVGFASQLESNDLWQWAIFVLLHIKDRNQRELAVQDVLCRFVCISKDVALSVKEKFIINNLGVPEKWVDYAKAMKAGVLRKYHLQAKYLLKAKQWSMAHEVIFQHITPDAVINDKLDYLYELLSQFQNTELQNYVKVPNWSNQGQLFLDYIDINRKFKALKTYASEADIEARWENLKPHLADLCSRICLLPCPTPKHRLCQSEIAQSLACLVRGVLIICPVINSCLIIKIVLERLPLPQEFAQEEIRVMLDSLNEDLAKLNDINDPSASTKDLVK